MKIISGGQTGADQAGWRAAKRAGLETGGWMPLRFKTEDGFHPEFAKIYDAKEFQSFFYPARTRQNVADADITLWFHCGDDIRESPDSPGYYCTMGAARKLKKDFLVVTQTYPTWVLAAWLKGLETVNIAGSRESKSPGIGEWVEQYLHIVFMDVCIAAGNRAYEGSGEL